MPHSAQRWYLPDELRETLQAHVQAYEGGYRAVGKRIGISGAALHRLLKGQAASSKALPALCRLFGLDLTDYLPLDPEQQAWLRLLDDLRLAGKDPQQLEQAMRTLASLPKL